jgi:hypothetical protein
MSVERASRSISLVLVSSALVFAGWAAGDYMRQTSGPRSTTGHYYPGYHGGSHFFWYHSAGPAYVGGGTSGGRSSFPGPSLRGGFGSSGHAAGA